MILQPRFMFLSRGSDYHRVAHGNRKGLSKTVFRFSLPSPERHAGVFTLAQHTIYAVRPYQPPSFVSEFPHLAHAVLQIMRETNPYPEVISGVADTAFLQPICPSLHRPFHTLRCHRGKTLCSTANRLRKTIYLVQHPLASDLSRRRRRQLVFPIVAVQTKPVSGDSDGEVHETLTPQKSYSVGVTIVSGFDGKLRRNVIEKVVAESSVGRVVVVTTGGMASTDEPDRDSMSTPVVSAEDSQSAAVPTDETAPETKLNGHAGSVSTLSTERTSRAINNLEGWISCSSAEEMAEVVSKLSASRECDYIIAEGSLDNRMEPQELAQLLRSRCGASLRIDSLVSVLDGDTLLHDLAIVPADNGDEDDGDHEQGVREGKTPEGIQDATDTRPMMVVSLVENATVIIVNHKVESSQDDQLNRVQSLVSVLNDSANIVSATSDTVPVDQLVNTNAYDHESVMLFATWKKVLLASRKAEQGVTKTALPKNLKDTTFVYKAKRPFHPTRLYEHIKAVATFAGVIRSTGRIWLATRMLAPLEWNQAGVAATLCVGKHFWAAVPESQWPSDEKEREKIMSHWDTQYGDRETEIVFVGMDIDKKRLEGLLDGCLLQDEEMVFNNMWENFEDPFVEWVPLIEDEEESIDDSERSPYVDVPTQELQLKKQTEESSATHQETPVPSDDSPSLANESNGADLPDESASGTWQEGELPGEELPDDLVEKISALDVFERGFKHDSDADLVQQAKDDLSYDADKAVIASWSSADSDEILTQVPRTGLPVTIVTGFLGSGKTTLLNYILTADHGLRIAVLVNEFGEIDIDNQLVEKGDWSSEDEVLQLANGCICCSINDSFVEAVQKVLQRSEEVDYLLVETTGVADPVPVINSLMVSDIAESVRVDGILTLVDADNFDPETHMQSEAALSQVMAADTILLSKTDITPAHKVDKTIEYIKSVRPAARILRSQRGRVPIHMILDVGLRVADSAAHLNPVRETGTEEDDGKRKEGITEEPESQEAVRKHDDMEEPHNVHNHDSSAEHDHTCGPDCTDESHSHSHDHHNHIEADGFVTTSFRSDSALDAELFMNKFLGRLPEGVFRAKGLLRFHGYGQRYIFQLSGRRYQFEEDEWPDDVAPGNQMVVIGRDLNIETLRSTLESCLVHEGQ